MATGDIGGAWNAATALTVTNLQGLVSSSTFLGVWESAALDNTGLLDRRLTAEIKVGASGVTAGEIRLYIVGQLHDVGGTPVWPDVIDGTESTETLSAAAMLVAVAKGPVAWVPVTATNDAVYWLNCPSVRDALGALPRRMVVLVCHNTTATLASSGAPNKVWEQSYYEHVTP